MANDLKGVKVKGTPYHFDYNELSNRPFGDVKRVPLFPFIEGPITTDASFITKPCAEYLSLGDTYIVTWDGEEFTCLATYVEGHDSIPPTVALTPITGDVEHPPFGIQYDTNNIALTISAADELSNHTVKVEHNIASKISSKDLGLYIAPHIDETYSALTVVDGTMEMDTCTVTDGEVTYNCFIGVLPSAYNTRRLAHRLLIDGCPYGNDESTDGDDGSLSNFFAVNEPTSLSLTQTYGSSSGFSYILGSQIKSAASTLNLTEEFLSTINDNTLYLMFITNSEMPTHTIKLDCRVTRS